MRNAMLAVAISGLLVTMGTALAADKPNLPSSQMPGTNLGTAGQGLIKSPLKPVISTAGAEPYFGVLNTGSAPSAAGAVLNITCVPAAQNGPVCMLNNSNDPMAQSGVATVNVPVLAKNETKWFGLAGCAPVANKPCTPVPGSTAAKNWEKAGYNFMLVVAKNSTNGIHTWNRP